MYDNITIFRGNIKKNPKVSVFDGNKLIHTGQRPVDYNFAERVENELQRLGYEAVVQGTDTTFKRA